MSATRPQKNTEGSGRASISHSQREKCCSARLRSIGMFFPAQLVAVFQKDPEVVAIGEGALRVQLVALFFQPMTVCANMMFQSIWKNGRATLLAMLRNLMYYSEKRLTVPA